MIQGVDNAAHVGGLLGGMALGIFMAVAPAAAARAPRWRAMRRAPRWWPPASAPCCTARIARH